MIALLTAMVCLSSCDDQTLPGPLIPVKIQLAWFHQSQFAGFYAAAINGNYAAAGLDVDFIEGGPSIQAITAVLDQSAQFGLAAPDQIILWRADGDAIHSIATIYQRSPRVYIALAQSGISRPQDFAGKVISVGSNGRPLLETLLSNVGITPDQYHVVATKPGLEQLYSGEVQVRSVFLTNEVLAARAAGYDINIIYPHDYRVHFYGDTIFTSDALIAAQPELVQKFLEASLQGWTYVIENPQQAGQLVQHYNPQADGDLEVRKMLASLPLINTGESKIGDMQADVWTDMEQTLRAQNLLSKPLQAGEAYTLQFLGNSSR
jgi:NitT/TauT family transport system substrate-binding protein